MNLLKKPVKWSVGLIASMFMLILLSLPTYAQVVAPKISCVATVEGTTSATVQVKVDTGGANIDSVRMEMLYPTANLSTPALAIGSDFDTPVPGGSLDVGGGTMLLVQTYGRSTGLGPGSGELQFSTVEFDWTGVPTTIEFNPESSDVGQGSFQFLVGDRVALNVEPCDVGDPTSVAFNKVGAFSSVSTATLLLGSVLLVLATSAVVVSRKS